VINITNIGVREAEKNEEKPVRCENGYEKPEISGFYSLTTQDL
jgi:hypothetical protein